MQKTSTIHQFLQALYESNSPIPEANLPEAIQQEAKRLKNTIAQLPTCLKSPSDTSVQIILNYSKKTSQLDAIL